MRKIELTFTTSNILVVDHGFENTTGSPHYSRISPIKPNARSGMPTMVTEHRPLEMSPAPYGSSGFAMSMQRHCRWHLAAQPCGWCAGSHTRSAEAYREHAENIERTYQHRELQS